MLAFQLKKVHKNPFTNKTIPLNSKYLDKNCNVHKYCTSKNLNEEVEFQIYFFKSALKVL